MRNITPYGTDGLFHDKFFRDFFNTSGGLFGATCFKTDILDRDDSFLLEAELPGCRKEDISVDIDGTSLSIRATYGCQNGACEIDNSDYVRRERTVGTCQRTFDISGVNTEKISAEYVDGVLRVNLPKKEEPESHTRHLRIQ